MKRFKNVLTLFLCLSVALSLCGCGAKPIPRYNVAVEGRTLDKTNPVSVIENALLVDIYEKMASCEAIASVYDEYAKEQKGKVTTYYVVATVGGYLYENGKLNRSYGSSPFAAKITLKQAKAGYDVVGFTSLRNFEELEERNAYIEENFPKGTDAESLFKGRSKALFEAEKQQIIQNYGFAESEFSTGDELIELLPVTNEAYYTLIEYFSDYPEHLGNITKIENGQRYTYATYYNGEDGGKGVVSYVKTNEAGEEIQRYDVNVDGDYVEIPEGLLVGVDDGEIYIDDAGYSDTEQPTTTKTPEEIEEIMKNEFNYDDGIEYTLVD